MLNGRIYRAAFAPLLPALAIAGFSLTGRSGPLTSSLAPYAFNGPQAYAELQSLAAKFPERRPGSRGDQELAGYLARTLAQPGGAGGSGFAVTVRSTRAQTIDGERTLTTVIAQRPGTTGERPIAILAHRDAAGAGAQAELSATAALLELGRVLAAGETQRTVILVSTSGGSGGNAGAREFAARGTGRASEPLDAAIVLGDLAGSAPRASFLAPFSQSPGSAPEVLQQTLSQAIAQQTGVAPGTPSTLSQLAQLVFPLTAGEQGPLGAQGVASVLVQAGGELPPAAGAPVSAARLETLGRAVLSAVYALDGAPEGLGGVGGSEKGLPIQHKLVPAWSLRLVVAALLLPPLLVALDGLAWLRRRRLPSARRTFGRWLLWTLACGLPFLACALFAALLGAVGAFAAPEPLVSPAALPLGGSTLAALAAVALVLALAWLAWPSLMRRLDLPIGPSTDGAGHAVVLVLAALAVVVWAVDPFTALLLVLPLHLWLLLVAPERSSGARLPRSALVALVALGALPLALLIAFYAHQFGLGVGAVAHTALLLIASGRVGIAGILLWSIAAGCLVAALMIALAGSHDLRAPDDETGASGPPAGRSSTIRGPMSYAGPGSLGGTDSALRR